MPSNILIRFLGAGLINVGGDDTKLEKLQETATDLAAILKKTPSKAASFALIAFDPQAPIDDPVVKEAMEALQARWATYVNTFSGTPVAVIRAMLLDALARAAAENDKVGVAFVTSARNALPFMEASNEREIWIEVVADIERKVDNRAEQEWAMPETITVSAMSFAPPEAIKVGTTPVAIDRTVLLKKFEAATGPQNHAGQPTNGNPHWPQSNTQAWVYEFSKRMADTIGEALNTVANGSQVQPIDLSGPLSGLSEAVSLYVDSTLKTLSAATAGLQRRTNLIWWKESLYSPSAKKSYRGMPTSTAAALMSFDLHRQVPTFSPASVAAFLHETVLELPSVNASERQPIGELLTAAMAACELAPLRDAAAELVPRPDGRGPLLGLLGHGVDPSDKDKFRALIGIPAATALTPPEWATWLFRELQAARAAREGAETKKRGRQP